MLLTLKARYFAQLLAVVVLVGASPADAQGVADNSAVLAEDQGIGVAISNFTRYTFNKTGPTTSDDGLAGPGFPSTILPAQHTGTGVFLKGGSDASITAQYVLENTNGGSVSSGSLGFMLTFQGDKSWKFFAASEDVLHDVKEKVSSDAKTNIKNAALNSGEDAVKAAGAEDGMTEVIDTMKVIKEVAQALGALKPSYVMKYEFEELDDSGYMQTFEADPNNCISANTSKPGAANVVILGPRNNITPDTADEFFVLSAFGTSKVNPGFVDVSITPVCAHVCAAWNASNDWLDDYTSSECTTMLAGASDDPQTTEISREQATYLGYYDLNQCLTVTGGANFQSRDSTPWATVTDQANSQRWQPTINMSNGWIETDVPCKQKTQYYPVGADSICGTCPLGASLPPGSWQESCDQSTANWDKTTNNLCATCEREDDGVVGSFYSCETCSSDEFVNIDGKLYCQGDAPTPPIAPPGEWQNFCNLNSGTYNYDPAGPELCAQCVSSDFVGIPDWNETPSVKSCAYCPGNVDVDVQGQLVCDPPL